MAGYFGRPDLTDQALHDGWLHTGDRGFIHDGELYVCGRQKDIVIVRGANHAPEEFEAALEGLPGVRTGCAVAVGFVPPGDEDEALAMLVETTSDATPGLAQEVASRVQQHTGILPAHVELLAPGTLPRTSSGKLRRREALNQWLTGKLAPPKEGHGRQAVGPGGQRRTAPGACSAGTTQQEQPVRRIEREGTKPMYRTDPFDALSPAHLTASATHQPADTAGHRIRASTVRGDPGGDLAVLPARVDGPVREANRRIDEGQEAPHHLGPGQPRGGR